MHALQDGNLVCSWLILKVALNPRHLAAIQAPCKVLASEGRKPDARAPAVTPPSSAQSKAVCSVGSNTRTIYFGMNAMTKTGGRLGNCNVYTGGAAVSPSVTIGVSGARAGQTFR